MIPDTLVQLFFEETSELLRDFEDGVLALERTPDDAELLNRVFRSAHTIKGNSGMLGFKEVARFAHALEDVLLRLRKRELTADRSTVELLLGAGDTLGRLVDGVRTGHTDAGAGVEESLAALAAHAGGEAPAPRIPRPAPAVAPPAPGESVYQVTFRPPADLLQRGLDPLRLLDDLAALGTLTDTTVDDGRLPALADVDAERVYLGFTCRIRTREPREAIIACFDFVGDPAAVTVEPAEPATPAVEAAAPAALAAEAAPPVAEAASLRVPAAKIDALVDLVGELVVTQSMIAQAVAGGRGGAGAARVEELVAQMTRHTSELEARVMAIRMVPIRTLFARFPRMVRDLAHAGGKRVELQTSGSETELDKSLVEAMVDPLTHLLRNAVDHGLETPEARERAGKAATGQITLAAYHRGGSVFIEVADDGRGLDRERVLAKAREQGLVAASQTLDDEAVFAFIFRPGFSTAERITEVSGRGVGMDVVYRNIRRVGGAISIESALGLGTRFSVRLPLTLASLDGQAVRVGGETYVLPLGAIVESMRPRPEQVTTMLGGGEAIVLRGQLIPLVRLHRLFGAGADAEDPTQGLVVIVEHGGRELALLVDELLGQQQVVIKSLETNFLKVDGIAGATLLGDGRVALILDVAGIRALWRTSPVAVSVRTERER